MKRIKRLTRKAKNGIGYLAKINITVWKCIDRLGQYEDTGLTPEQIREIDRLYAEKCREMAEYQKMLGETAGVKESGNGR